MVEHFYEQNVWPVNCPPPWRAVLQNGTTWGSLWSIVNATDDPTEEFDVTETEMGEVTARFVARACNAHAELLAVCRKVFATSEDPVLLAECRSAIALAMTDIN